MALGVAPARAVADQRGRVDTPTSMNSTTSPASPSSQIPTRTSTTCVRSARYNESPITTLVMVSGYHEAVAMFSDPATFSSCNALTGPSPNFR